jgi:cytoskeletal protein RodZ
MEKRRLKQQELLEKFKTEPDENNARFPSQNESKEKQEKSLVEKVSIEEEDEFIVRECLIRFFFFLSFCLFWNRSSIVQVNSITGIGTDTRQETVQGGARSFF